MDRPIKPDPSDCCGSGCNPCILDVYENRLKIYEDGLKRNVESLLQNYNNCMSATSYSVFKLIAREKHTHDTYFYVFEYCRPHKKTDLVDIDRRLLYKPGQHFLIKAYDIATDCEFTRAYTPIPFMNTNLLSFTILVRIYKSGKMSTYLHNLKCGQETLWRGPYCDFTINYSFKNILFVAQGTGIAPIFAVIKDVIANEKCDSFLNLFFCCRSIGNILLRNEIYALASNWNFQYEVFLGAVDNELPKFNEKLHMRKLEKYDITKYLGSRSMDSLLVIICGSDKFKVCIKSYVRDSNVENEQIYEF